MNVNDSKISLESESIDLIKGHYMAKCSCLPSNYPFTVTNAKNSEV